MTNLQLFQETKQIKMLVPEPYFISFLAGAQNRCATAMVRQRDERVTI